MKYLKTLLYVFLGLSINFNLLAQNKVVTIKTERNSDKSIDFYYEKTLPGSYYIIIEFNRLENANKSTFKKVVKHYSGKLFNIKPIDENRGISFSYKFKYSIGEPNPKVDSLFQYTLPFKRGSEVGVMLNKNFFGEEFLESEKKPSWYSLKFFSKSTDTVLCTRKGVVVKIRDEYNDNSKNGKIVTTKSNSITIEHADGTLANYYGFKKGGIIVKLGEKVYPHTKLGLVKKYNDKYSFIFRQFYISDNKTIYNEDRKLKDIAKGKKYVIPYFKTSNGSEQLESKKIYTVEFNEDVFFKEFSKREKKKYLKSLKN